LENLGATTQLEELGDQTLPDGSKLPLPPVLLATLGTDPNKKTLLVYGHLDVQPA
jgi:nonspecific dipeptidase